MSKEKDDLKDDNVKKETKISCQEFEIKYYKVKYEDTQRILIEAKDKYQAMFNQERDKMMRFSSAEADFNHKVIATLKS